MLTRLTLRSDGRTCAALSKLNTFSEWPLKMAGAELGAADEDDRTHVGCTT
jgi:hypothetical protein